MIATTTRFSLSVSDSVAGQALSHRPRRITPDVGRALERLSHAIEYLTDEFVNGTDSETGSKDCLDAVRVLMTLRRHIYFESPEIPPLRDRCRGFMKQLLA